MPTSVHVGSSRPSGFFETEPSVWVLNEHGEYCLRRRSFLGIEYQRPPLPVGCPTWERASLGANLFDLKFFKLPDAAYSLWELCAELRQGGAEWKQYPCGAEQIPEPLEKLDVIADLILQAAEELHGAGWGLGLISPENILIFECEGTLSVAFTDLGFSWGKSPPLIPPLFLRSPRDGNKFAILWDDQDPRKQLERGGPLGRNQLDPLPDIRALARVFASSLLGQYVSAVPSPEEHPETAAQSAYVPGGRRIWVTLEEAIAGGIPSVADFRVALCETPLSQHFLSDAPIPVSRRSWVRAVVVGAAVAAIGGGLIWFWRRTRPSEGAAPATPVAVGEGPGKADSEDAKISASHGSPQEGSTEVQSKSLPEGVQKRLNHLEQEANGLLSELEDRWQSYVKDPLGSYFATRKEVEGKFRPLVRKLSQEIGEIRNTIGDMVSPEVERVVQVVSTLEGKLRQLELELIRD